MDDDIISLIRSYTLDIVIRRSIADKIIFIQNKGPQTYVFDHDMLPGPEIFKCKSFYGYNIIKLKASYFVRGYVLKGDYLVVNHAITKLMLF